MKRGPVPKANPQGHRKRKLTVLPTLPLPDMPAPPDGLSDKMRQLWEDFWNSDLARGTKITDIHTIERLFRLRDRFEVSMGLAEEHIAVRGLQGQAAVSPWMQLAIKLNGEILRLELELGLTPTSRARLGIMESKDDALAKELRHVLEGR